MRLLALDYTNEGLNFLDDAGRDLSANRPQSVNFSYTVDAVGPMNVELSDWMANLPALSTLPLTQIPIPGTHDSGSYGITPQSPWARTGKDQFGILTELPAVLQDLSSSRSPPATARPVQGPLRAVQRRHPLRGPAADQRTRRAGLPRTRAALGALHRRGRRHRGLRQRSSREVLVVYVQGIKNFTADTHAAVTAQMDAAFGARMAPRALGTSATLQDLWAADRNVIVVYNNSEVVAADPVLWPGRHPLPPVASGRVGAGSAGG